MTTASERRVAMDWMRGLVMMIMTIDHASIFVNAERYHGDSVASPQAFVTLAQFFTRWVTHLCAPTFVFLAGTALYLSIERRGQRGLNIDRDLVIRGVLIMCVDFFWLSFLSQHHLFQVMYALGGAMILMVGLRRIPVRWLCAGTLLFVAGGEAITFLVWDPTDPHPSLFIALTLGRRMDQEWLAIYPLLHWTAVMALGWCFGALYAKDRRPQLPALFAAGLLALYAVVRAVNAYGNMRLYRQDGGLVQWLNVCKYPPAISFLSLELGIMFTLLAVFTVFEQRSAKRWDWSPLLVFGQTALFFYVLHHALLKMLSMLLGFDRDSGLPAVYLVAPLGCAILYPLCFFYRRAKRRHPNSVLRFL